MAYEAYNVQRTSDGLVLQGEGGSPLAAPRNPVFATSNLDTNYRIIVEYTQDFKNGYSAIGSIIDSLPLNGEIYRINPIFVS